MEKGRMQGCLFVPSLREKMHFSGNWGKRWDREGGKKLSRTHTPRTQMMGGTFLSSISQLEERFFILFLVQRGTARRRKGEKGKKEQGRPPSPVTVGKRKKGGEELPFVKGGTSPF